jgi:hypothetical protein
LITSNELGEFVRTERLYHKHTQVRYSPHLLADGGLFLQGECGAETGDGNPRANTVGDGNPRANTVGGADADAVLAAVTPVSLNPFGSTQGSTSGG